MANVPTKNKDLAIKMARRRKGPGLGSLGFFGQTDQWAEAQGEGG